MSGLRIKLYREKNGYSQEDLARILGVTRRTVSRWEQNSSKPNEAELKRLATLLGVTEDEILSDEDDLISPSKDAGQNILGKISDSVDNLVTGQEIINERLANNRDEYIDKQSELINSLQDQNKQLLSKLEEQSRLIESYKKAVDTSRIEIRHKRIRTAVLIFTKTNHGGTDKVWFYDMKADGFTLDDKRTPIETSDIPDVVARFNNLADEESRGRTDQSFFVPKEEIASNGYDLSINKYKKVEYKAVEYPPTSEIMAKLEELDSQSTQGLAKLKEMLAE